jgi:hypothetical protein
MRCCDIFQIKKTEKKNNRQRIDRHGSNRPFNFGIIVGRLHNAENGIVGKRVNQTCQQASDGKQQQKNSMKSALTSFFFPQVQTLTDLSLEQVKI